MSFANSDTFTPHTGLHSRIALALAHAAVDSQNQEGVIPYGSTVHQRISQDSHVEQLLASTNEWGNLINHEIPHNMAQGIVALNGFRHYMIQDAAYLENYYRVNLEAVRKSGTWKDVTDFATKLASHAHYVPDAFETCTDKLGVPKDVVAKEPPSTQLQSSIKFYEEVVANKDSWLDIHIALLPCILGYDTIAGNLLKEPTTVRNTPYFPLWIQANTGGSSPGQYKDFIDHNITEAQWTANKARWFKIFEEACKKEQAFFELAKSGFPAYNIVPASKFFRIRSYLAANPYLVSTSPTSVTTQTAVPDDKGKWELINTLNGYTIRNVSQNASLSVSVTSPLKPVYDVSVSSSTKNWSINVIEAYDAKDRQAYQLFVPEKLQYVLDAGDAGSNPNDKTFVTNNSQKSSQIWLLEAVN